MLREQSGPREHKVGRAHPCLASEKQPGLVLRHPFLMGEFIPSELFPLLGTGHQRECFWPFTVAMPKTKELCLADWPQLCLPYPPQLPNPPTGCVLLRWQSLRLHRSNRHISLLSPWFWGQQHMRLLILIYEWGKQLSRLKSDVETPLVNVVAKRVEVSGRRLLFSV